MGDNLIEEAREKLNHSIRLYKGKPIGTVAASETTSKEEQELNYNECFIRDFFPSGLAFIMQGEREIVRNFLEVTLGLQFDLEKPHNGQGLFREVREAMVGKEPQSEDGIRPGFGLMPASFKVVNYDEIKADFGQKAIGRVTPVDSGLWWIFLLHIYEKACDRAQVPEEKIAHRD